MNLPKLIRLISMTKYFILGTVVIWIVYDFWVFDAAGNNDATISAQLIEWWHAYPTIPLAVGYVLGHIGWGKKTLRGDD